MHSTATTDQAWFTQCLNNTVLIDRLQKISLVVCDIDGSLTDGTIYVNQTEEYMRGFSVVDGFAFKPAQRAGIDIAFMSGKHNNSVLVRAKTLGIPDNLILQGISDKREATKTVLASLGRSPNAMLIFGDDVLDAQVKESFNTVLFACPCDAPFYIQKSADVVIPRPGGRHALRLLLDLMLFIHNKHPMQGVIEKSLNEHNA